jgi:hypothetical protein
MKRRIRLDIVRGILMVGLTSAVAVFFTAVNPADNPLGNPQEDSKIYRRTMEMVGGQANLVASDITDWVTGLWHGRTLAYTLAVLTLVAAYGFFFITEDRAPE